MSIADAINKAVSVAPMASALGPIMPNRTLRIDGDGLAYYCAGKDGSDPADARRAVLDKIRSAQRACRAGKTVVLLTASGSIKGGRYAVATVKPYQGQRVSSRRPENWRFLRDFLEAYDGQEFTVVSSLAQEADDLFAQASHESEQPHEDCVIYTQDKDMRMIPGMHLNWVDHSMVIVPKGTWCIEHNDKVYGRKWFWLQMLHGDTADNIPGLPKYGTTNAKGEAVFKPVGEVTATNAMDSATCEEDAINIVQAMYSSFYSRHVAELHIAEQGQLLWMQREADSLDVFSAGAPLYWVGADTIDLIDKRITEAQAINDLANKTQDDAG